jgi:predicted DNA-binding protein (MmcQ/YjbR family)
MGIEWEETAINLKCDPEKAEELRDEYPDIVPGYHMNKKHWNTVYTTRGLADDLIISLIDHSYDLIFSKLPRKVREELLHA